VPSLADATTESPRHAAYFVLLSAADLVRTTGIARGTYIDSHGRLDAAGAIYAAADVLPLTRSDFAQVGAEFHPRYAADARREAVSRAWSALRALAAYIDPACAASDDDGITLDAIDRLVGAWSDTGTAHDVAHGLLVAAAKLLQR
jgi:hypothetical protein